MFQTEPVVYLQSLGGEWLTTLMSWVTLLGYTEYQIPLVIVIALGFSVRKGILLVHMMNWNGVLTGFSKEYFALPRPPAVDSAVQHMGTGDANTSPFAGRGARSFWSLLDTDIVQHFRSAADASWGFPSGHVSGTTTVWGGMCILLRSIPLRIVAVGIIVLMPISRMYLGRHFLADVIGGLVLGGAVVGVTYALFLRGGRRARYFEDDLPAGTWGIGRLALFAYLLLIPFVFLMVFPQYDADDAGRFFGIDLAFVALLVIGLPSDAAPIWRRATRILAASVMYVAFLLLVDQAISTLKLAETPSVEFAAGAIPAFVCMLVAVAGGAKIGLYLPAAKVD